MYGRTSLRRAFPIAFPCDIVFCFSFEHSELVIPPFDDDFDEHLSSETTPVISPPAIAPPAITFYAVSPPAIAPLLPSLLLQLLLL